jgi:uncharacterized protein YndB with AHSA1/START domain
MLGPIHSRSCNGGGRAVSPPTTSKMDVKPGGVWGFVMHGPDGRDYQNRITYLEVVKPQRLVYK